MNVCLLHRSRHGSDGAIEPIGIEKVTDMLAKVCNNTARIEIQCYDCIHVHLVISHVYCMCVIRWKRYTNECIFAFFAFNTTKESKRRTSRSLANRKHLEELIASSKSVSVEVREGVSIEEE